MIDSEKIQKENEDLIDMIINQNFLDITTDANEYLDIIFNVATQCLLEKQLKEIERSVIKINEDGRCKEYWIRKMQKENDKIGKILIMIKKLKKDMKNKQIKNNIVPISQETVDGLSTIYQKRL